MIKHSFALTTVVAVVLLSAPALAQSRMEAATAAAAAQAAAEQEAAPPRDRTQVTAIPASPDAAVLGDPYTRQRYLEAMQRYYQYRADGYAYRSRVFEWQLFSSRVIFVVVLALVAAGMFFAAVQFRLAMRSASRQSPATAADEATAAGASLVTRFEVSAKGLAVNSSVLGVIILALSLAFFYLYLVYVYPIENVF
jgi:hypothetical protein